MKNTSSSSCAVADEMQLASSNPEKSRRWRSTARQASDAHPALEPGEQHGVVVAMGLTEERGSANTAASLTRNGEKGRGGGVFARPRGFDKLAEAERDRGRSSMIACPCGLQLARDAGGRTNDAL